MIKLLLLLTLLVGCTEKTKFGPCIGVLEDKDPKFTYRIPVNNVVIGVVFSESIFVPVIVILTETYCPISLKGETP